MAEHGFLWKHVVRLGWQWETFKSWLSYLRRRKEFDAAARGKKIYEINEPTGHRNRHIYRITEDGKTFTTSQMDQRYRLVSRLYPERLTSLLDIGCCRGWFVVQAALRPECEKATGVDVVQGFIDAANKAKDLLKLDKAQFDFAYLDDLASDPVRFRTPYQTIVLLNTYHYMYWGSSYSDNHKPDHDYLLRTLAAMCTDRMLFMSPLEVEDCPSDIARRAKDHPEWAAGFTTEQFLEAAKRYFDVTPQGLLGLRPLYLMKKR
jgi:hypothetical protein